MKAKDEFVIAVTGAGGLLGSELTALQREGIKLIGLSRSELDVTSSSDQCYSVLHRLQPDAVIHCAAYTAVDQAESEPDKARQVNVEGSRHVAVAAERLGAKLIYISTDYVFSGDTQEPYEEYDSPGPQTVYGKTKLDGEYAAAAACSKLFIVRTSWLFGKNGPNFVQTMLSLAEQRKDIRVVDDQLGSPTYAADLSEFLIALSLSEKYGKYHASNAGVCSWYEFAEAIFETAGIKEVSLRPCSTIEFPRPAARPKYSILGNRAIMAAGFQSLRHWKEALRAYLVQ